MNILTAHARYAERCLANESFPSPGVDFVADITPAVMTAACSLSGMLEDCETDEQLDEAVKHFETLFDADIVSLESLQQEVVAVVNEVCQYCEAAAWN